MRVSVVYWKKKPDDVGDESMGVVDDVELKNLNENP